MLGPCEPDRGPGLLGRLALDVHARSAFPEASDVAAGSPDGVVVGISATVDAGSVGPADAGAVGPVEADATPRRRMRAAVSGWGPVRRNRSGREWLLEE